MSRLTVFLIAAAAAAAGALAEPRAVLADDLRVPGGGTIRALVVGVDVYSRLPASVQLQGARADAEDIAEAEEFSKYVAEVLHVINVETSGASASI